MAKLKTKSPYFWLAVVLVLAGGWLLFRKNSSAPATKTQLDSQITNAQPNGAAGQKVEGLLKLSNNRKLGNLMLVTTSRTVYISTSRDFSDLVGKPVTVSYDGTLDNFRLGDIVLK